MSSEPAVPRSPIILAPGEGRAYAMPAMRAVFKVDGVETRDRYCASEWWIEPNSNGPGAHVHEANDEVFYVTEGTPSVLVGETWHDAPIGSFLMIPAGTVHEFANRTGERACLFNVFVPGGFEKNMPAIVKWFADNPRSTAPE